jgi:WD40 repeat protein
VALGFWLGRRRRSGPVIDVPEQDDLGDRRYPWYPRELIQVLGDDRGRHWGAVRTVAYQPGGGLIASGGDDAVIRFWNPETLREERPPFRGHTAAVRQVVFTPDGKSVISLGNDGTMRLWDVESGEQRHRFAGSETVSRLFFSPDGQWVRGLHPPLNVLSWKLTTTEQGLALNPPFGGFTCWQLSADGQLLAVGENTPTARTWYQIRTWNLEKGREEYPPVLGPEKPKGYEDMAVSERAKVPNRYLVCLALTGPAKVVLGASNDGEVSLWDLASGTRRVSLPRQQHMVLLAALDPPGQRALVYTQDSSLRLWDVQSGKEAGQLEGHRGPVVSLAFSADGTHALTASEDSTLRLWDLDTCKELHPRSGHTHLVHDVAFSADGKQVLTGGADRTVRLWDVADGQELHKLGDHKEAVTSVAFLPEGSQVFSSDRSLTARLWDAAAERILFSFHWPPNDPPTAFHYSTTVPHALVGTSQGNLGEYDLTTSKPLVPVTNPAHSPAGCLAVSEDRATALLASSSATDCFVRVIDLAAGRERLRLPGHTEPIMALAFLSGAAGALSAGQDRALRRWDLQGKGKCEQEIELEGSLPKVVTSMTFSPDTTLLACAGYDAYQGVVLLWDVEAGRLRARWEMFGPVQRLVFARDSTHLATANANGTVFIYRLDRSTKV